MPKQIREPADEKYWEEVQIDEKCWEEVQRAQCKSDRIKNDSCYNVYAIQCGKFAIYYWATDRNPIISVYQFQLPDHDVVLSDSQTFTTLSLQNAEEKNIVEFLDNTKNLFPEINEDQLLLSILKLTGLSTQAATKPFNQNLYLCFSRKLDLL